MVVNSIRELVRHYSAVHTRSKRVKVPTNCCRAATHHLTIEFSTTIESCQGCPSSQYHKYHSEAAWNNLRRPSLAQPGQKNYRPHLQSARPLQHEYLGIHWVLLPLPAITMLKMSFASSSEVVLVCWRDPNRSNIPLTTSAHGHTSACQVLHHPSRNSTAAWRIHVVNAMGKLIQNYSAAQTQRM